MQKVVSFLEKNVQWIAMGLGALFLVYMIYDFVVTKPVTSSVGGTEVTPGQIDDRIRNGPARQLEAVTREVTAPPMPVQNFLEAEKVAFDTDGGAPLGMAATSNYITSGSTPDINLPAPSAPIANPVVQLPAAPAPLDLKTSDGRSTVMIPPSPVAAGGQPAPAPVEAASNTGVDCNWVSVSASIPTKTLAANFADQKIPAAPSPLSLTTLLRVEMVRQEQDGEGNWGSDTTIEPLKNVALQPLPAPDAQPFQTSPYETWAEGDQGEIAQPPFYQVMQADPWRIPGGQIPQPAQAVADAAFDPSKVTSTKDLTPDQRKMYDAYMRQKDQEKRDAARQRYMSRRSGGGGGAGAGGPPGSMPPGFGGGGGGFGGGGPGGPGGGQDVKVDDSAPMLLAQNYRPGSYPPGMPPGMGGYPGMGGGYPGMGGMPPGMMPGMEGMPGMQPGSANQAVDAANSAMLAAAQATLPKGPFTPSAQPDIVVWAHDASVLPGKTYRYRLRYNIKNPVFQTTNLCKPQSLANQFLITSAWSDWTDAISVKSVTNFYAVNASPTKDSVKFDIFRWKNGNWQVESLEASPGDMVGTARGDGPDKVDFSTGWTLVDVRTDPHNGENKIIILTTDNGQTLRKDLAADRASTEYKNLKAQTDAAKANPANPGGPAGPGGRPAPGAAAAAGGINSPYGGLTQ